MGPRITGRCPSGSDVLPPDRHPRWDLQLANLEAYQALA